MGFVNFLHNLFVVYEDIIYWDRKNLNEDWKILRGRKERAEIMEVHKMEKRKMDEGTHVDIINYILYELNNSKNIEEIKKKVYGDFLKYFPKYELDLCFWAASIRHNSGTGMLEQPSIKENKPKNLEEIAKTGQFSTIIVTDMINNVTYRFGRDGEYGSEAVVYDLGDTIKIEVNKEHGQEKTIIIPKKFAKIEHIKD